MASAAFELLTELSAISERIAVAPLPLVSPDGRRELEDRVAFALFLVSRIDRACAPESDDESFDPAKIDWNHVRAVNELYTGWLEAVEPTVSKLESLEQEYGKLEGADELRVRFRDVKLMPRDTDRVRRSIESLIQGQGIPFDRAMEELRANLL